MYAWRGPEVEITQSSPRIPAERNWYAVTGRVVGIQVEDDGDLHVVMENTDGRRGRIVVELPVGRPWCKLRTAVFSWTNARFTLLPRERDSMPVTRHPIVTVIERASYDVGHASRNPLTNRRDYDRRVAVWEIHPVMRLIQSVGPVF
jgi:hypothetical protein